MAVYQDENVTIGTVNTADDTNFVPDTRIWAGGFRQNGAVNTWAEANSYGTGDLVRIVNGATFIFRANKNINVGTPFSLADWDPQGDLFNVSEVMRSQGTSIVTATGCTITVQGGGNDSGLWRHTNANETGTFNFTDVLITSHANGVNASTNNDLIFNNVTWVSTGLLGQATFGSWHGGAARNFEINGFNIWFNAINTNQATGVFFPGNVTGDLNGISLWNGVIGDDILGAALTFNNKIFSNLQSGPIGYVPPTGDGGRIPADHRALYRCVATGTQVGMLLGYDYRGLHGQDGNYVFGADNGGHHWIINPLQGTPNGSLSFGNAFQSSTASGVRIAVGNRPTTTAGDVKLVNSSHGTNTFYRAPATFSSTTIPVAEATGVIGLDTSTSGVLISNQISSIAVGGYTPTAVVTVDPRSYRSYSWQQQDWGTLRQISPPAPAGVTDASNTLVEQVRMSGNYPDVTGDGFITALDINEDADPVTANFATFTAAVAGLHGTGRATTGRDAVASVKAVQYDGITTTHTPLVYTRTGTAVDFGTKDLIFQDVNGTPVPGGLTITIPASSLDLDPLSSVSSIQAKEIRVNGDILNNDNDKVELIGTDEVRLANLTAQNAIADAPTIVVNGTGTHSGADFTATNLTVSAGTLTEGNAFTAKTGTTMFIGFTGLIANRVYSPEELLGDAYDITDLDTVTISSSVTIRIQTNDTQILGGSGVTVDPIIIRHGIRPEGTLAEVQAAGGFFDVINMATGVSVLTPPGPVNCATITDFDAVTALKVDGDATVWKSYYKPLNVFGPAGTGEAFALAIAEHGVLTTDIQIAAVQHVDLLVRNGLDASLAGVTIMTSLVAGGFAEPGPGENVLRVGLQGPGNELTAAQTQAMSMTVANTLNYFNIHIDNPAWDVELFSPGTNNSSIWTNQTVGVRFEIADATFQNQQRVSQAPGIPSPTAGGAAGTVVVVEVLNIPSGNATLALVQTAVQEIVGEELMDILENQVALVTNQGRMQTATQRGAVKAAAYSAPALIDADDDTNFNNPTV